MHRFFAVLAVLLFAAAAHGQQSEPFSYDLKVRIEPGTGDLTVRGTLMVPVSPEAKELSFGLHETFAIRQLKVDGRIARFTFRPGPHTPFNPAAGTVRVRFPARAEAAHEVRLDIEYDGRLKHIPEWGSLPDQKEAMDDQVNARLVQLASYSSWYPQVFAFGHPFRIGMEVSLPQGWTAVCSGAKTDARVQDGRAVTQWASPRDFDILIVAAPDFRLKTVQSAGVPVEIYDTQLPAAFVEREAKDLSAVMELFTKTLGKAEVPGGTVRHVFSPLKKGQGRAGIARAGIIVTSEGRVLEQLATHPDYSLFQDVAHEIAHFWWNFGADQGDWINETFAEYFSTVAVEKIVSKQKFEDVLAYYRRQVGALPADTPPLSRVPFDGSYFVVRYYKGSLLVDHLRRDLGDDRFFEAAKAFFRQYRGKGIGTAEFRSFWRPRMADPKAFDLWLDGSGGLPATSADGRAAR